jgi:hypothetical protein
VVPISAADGVDGSAGSGPEGSFSDDWFDTAPSAVGCCVAVSGEWFAVAERDAIAPSASEAGVSGDDSLFGAAPAFETERCDPGLRDVTPVCSPASVSDVLMVASCEALGGGAFEIVAC